MEISATLDESIIKHLEMIQGVINRLAGNSFMLKGWSVTVVSALFALAAQAADMRFVLVSLYPALAFWFLDAYYLNQERLFRALYDLVRQDTAKSITPFSMNTAGAVSQKNSWFLALWSPTILCLHGPILTIILVVTIYAIYK